jgi:hypothetical protein
MQSTEINTGSVINTMLGATSFGTPYGGIVSASTDSGSLLRLGTTPPQMSTQDYLRQYNIQIKFLSRGCVITIGCKEIPFSDVTEAITCLSRYVSNPKEEAESWKIIIGS